MQFSNPIPPTTAHSHGHGLLCRQPPSDPRPAPTEATGPILALPLCRIVLERLYGGKPVKYTVLSPGCPMSVSAEMPSLLDETIGADRSGIHRSGSASSRLPSTTPTPRCARSAAQATGLGLPPAPELVAGGQQGPRANPVQVEAADRPAAREGSASAGADHRVRLNGPLLQEPCGRGRAGADLPPSPGLPTEGGRSRRGKASIRPGSAIASPSHAIGQS